MAPASTAYNGVIIDCDTDFDDADGAPYALGDFFNRGEFENNESANPQLNEYMPTSNSRSLRDSVNIAEITGNEFFDNTYYRGGFDGMNDWTIGWTHQVTGGQ